MDDDGRERVFQLIASVTRSNRDLIRLESTMNDVEGWDSLANIKIVCGIEEILKRKLSLDEMISIVSVSDIVSLIEQEQELTR